MPFKVFFSFQQKGLISASGRCQLSTLQQLCTNSSFSQGIWLVKDFSLGKLLYCLIISFPWRHSWNIVFQTKSQGVHPWVYRGMFPANRTNRFWFGFSYHLSSAAHQSLCELSLVSHWSLLSLGVHVNVRQTVSFCVCACTYSCASVCNHLFLHLILSFREEITHSWFYSILRETSEKDHRKQGSGYNHLLSRWETQDRELLYG